MSESLASHTTFGVGGPAQALVEVRSLVELKEALSSIGRSVLILGGGSNVLVSPSGFPGTVLKPALKGIEQLNQTSTSVRVRVQAGENWDDWVAFAVNKGWSGIECLSGIPGWVGAAPVQNIGAYGQEVASTIREVHAIEMASQKSKSFSSDECAFSYRSSRFKRFADDPWIIHAVDFELGFDLPLIQHRELAGHLSTQNFSLSAVRKTVLEIRTSKGMLLDTQNPNRRSAGSFFVNPVVPPPKLAEIQAMAMREGWGEVPAYSAGGEGVKLSAAWMIERAGFSKGYQRGRARLSTKHCLALVAENDATALDLLELAKEVYLRVDQRFGVRLIPEPVLVGFEKTWEEFVAD